MDPGSLGMGQLQTLVGSAAVRARLREQLLYRFGIRNDQADYLLYGGIRICEDPLSVSRADIRPVSGDDDGAASSHDYSAVLDDERARLAGHPPGFDCPGIVTRCVRRIFAQAV